MNGVRKVTSPMRNSRLLFLVRLSFSTSTKDCGFSLLEDSKGLLHVYVAPDFALAEFSLTHFATRGLRLLNHRLPTLIIPGSPDLFAFYTLSPIPWYTHYPELIGLSLNGECEGRGECNPYYICQFPNLINYDPQNHHYKQLVDMTIGLINSWLNGQGPC